MSQNEHSTELDALLKQHIRDIPDFPEPGIMFRDITPLLADAKMFRLVIDEMIKTYRDTQIDKVVVIESRGFIFGTPIAYGLDAGVIPVRKPGKLPGETYAEEYALEYGSNTLEIHRDAIHDHERVIIVDDLLATGGTVQATIRLVERFGGEIAGISVLAELIDLKGRERLGNYPVHSLVTY